MKFNYFCIICIWWWWNMILLYQIVWCTHWRKSLQYLFLDNIWYNIQIYHHHRYYTIFHIVFFILIFYGITMNIFTILCCNAVSTVEILNLQNNAQRVQKYTLLLDYGFFFINLPFNISNISWKGEIGWKYVWLLNIWFFLNIYKYNMILK